MHFALRHHFYLEMRVMRSSKGEVQKIGSVKIFTCEEGIARTAEKYKTKMMLYSVILNEKRIGSPWRRARTVNAPLP